MDSQDKSKIRLYLASASPRRRELLEQLALRHEVLDQDIDESMQAQETAQDYVQRMALEKARAALLDPRYTRALPVLAADTIVVCDGRVLGKPANAEAALDMLSLLSGRQHQVLTAICVSMQARTQQCLVSTAVSFRKISEAEMLAYWFSGEPCDKAGAYAIQGLGAMFISRIEGSYSSVVGLPLFETIQLLANFGISASAVMKEYRK